MIARPLDHSHACWDTGRSLKNTSSTPAPCCEAGFFVPSFRPLATAGRARSLGVSGIREDPDALVCVESTPTPFRVAFSLGNLRRHHA